MRDSFGIDHLTSSNLSSPLVQLNLLKKDDREQLFSFIRDPLCAYVHMAPPCGASSRARLIQRKHKRCPPILRTDQFPNGIPSLTNLNLRKVQSANNLYWLCRDIALCCFHRSVLFSIENPGRSFMWMCDSMVDLFKQMNLIRTFFHHCEFGSKRRKLTQLVHTIPDFQQLQVFCTNTHTHEKWGQNQTTKQWATAEEVHYPWPLCRRMAQLLMQTLVHLGAIPPNEDFLKQETDIPAMRALANMQSRGKRLLPFVKEHKQVISLTATPETLPFACVQQHKRLKTSFAIPASATAVPDCTEIPADSKIIRTQIIGVNSGNASAAEILPCGTPNNNSLMDSVDSATTGATYSDVDHMIGKSGIQHNIVFGVPWQPKEFVREAWKVGHPSHLETFLADDLQTAIQKNINEKAETLAKERTATIRKWISWSVQLQT